MVAWAYFTMPSPEELEQRQAEQAQQDSLEQVEADSQRQDSVDDAEESASEEDTSDSQSGQRLTGDDESQPQNMGIFGEASRGDTVLTKVETPKYDAVFTNVGAGPAQITLKDYFTWNDKPVRMIKDTTESAYMIEFLSNENLDIRTDDLIFERLTEEEEISLQEGETTEISYALNVEEDKRIIYTYTLNGDNHEMDLAITFEGLDSEIIGGVFDFGWKAPLNLTERDPTQEGMYTSSYVYTGGEMEQLYLDEAGRDEQSYNGNIDWVSTRSKFFSQIIKSESETDGALLVGEVSGSIDSRDTQYFYESYISTLIPDNGTAEFKLYTGPLSYSTLKDFEETAYDMVDVGYAVTRWFADPLVRYIIIPFFGLVDPFMNMGFAIILFAVLIKLVLYPLTKKSYRSMAAMKELQPKMKEIQEKYADDPQKQQKATMKLYKEEGVNPLGGCLPNLLQLPILITLWRFFQNSILIRQEEFLWAADLSAPDYILDLPFEIPFIGDQLAGFVLLMSVAMIFQSRISGGMSSGGGGAPGGMNMKALQYIFPAMMLFIFNNFAAGLSLYYLIYNVVSILQQLIIYRQMDKEKELAEAS